MKNIKEIIVTVTLCIAGLITLIAILAIIGYGIFFKTFFNEATKFENSFDHTGQNLETFQNQQNHRNYGFLTH